MWSSLRRKKSPCFLIAKLYWAKDSHSELQLHDVKNLLSTGCDRAYIERWTRDLAVDTLWKEVSHE